MLRLSSPHGHLKRHYQAIVIGSGYGGGIAASRLSRAGLKVCVLERGNEMWPGEYPHNEIELAKQLQTDFPSKRVGSPSALFDLRINKDINVIAGCGLGGTSLINAGICMRAAADIFSDPRWPEELRDESQMGLIMSL